MSLTNPTATYLQLLAVALMDVSQQRDNVSAFVYMLETVKCSAGLI